MSFEDGEEGEEEEGEEEEGLRTMEPPPRPMLWGCGDGAVRTGEEGRGEG